MRKVALLALAAVLVLLVLAVPAAAQRINASVKGTVSDPAGLPVANAAVKITQRGTGLTRSTTSNKEGAYLFGDLPAGTYDLEVSAEGFPPYTQKAIELNVAD